MTYRLMYEGATLDTYEGDGKGIISRLIHKVEKNPGMTIVAEVWQNVMKDDIPERVVQSTRVVYPVPA